MEAQLFWTGLRSLDGRLQGSGCDVAIAGLGYYEAKGDVFVWVGEFEEIGPVSWVEASERSEDEDSLVIADWVCGCSEVG